MQPVSKFLYTPSIRDTLVLDYMPYYGNWPSIDCQNQIIVTVRLTYKCLVINRVFKIRRDPCWWTSDASLAFLPSRFEPFDQTWEITDQRLVGWWPNLLSSWPTQTVWNRIWNPNPNPTRICYRSVPWPQLTCWTVCFFW